MTGRINRCSHCGCDEPIHNAIDGKLYCNNCGMSLEKLVGGQAMTVAELIKKLEDCPQDATVFVPLGIDWEELGEVVIEDDGVYIK